MAFTDYRITNLRFNIFNPETWEKFAPEMVGFENFVRVLTSSLAIENYDFVRLLTFNFVWTISNVFFHVVLGVIIALALNAKNLIRQADLPGDLRAPLGDPWADHRLHLAQHVRPPLRR